MKRIVAIGSLAAVCLALPASGASGRVLATGDRVDSHPVTVVAAATMIDPRRLFVDIETDPGTRVAAEWTVLCSDGPGPVTGGEYKGSGPAHRRVELPQRPRGFCFVDVEAKLLPPNARRGRLDVRLRGRAKPSPLSMN